MRLSHVFPTLKNHARVAQNEKKVPFKEAYPLVLKNRVTKSTNAGQDKNCLYEMSRLFACLKDNNFEESLCKKQMDVFFNCSNAFDKFRKEQKELQKVGIPNPGSKHFTNKQISYLLRQYPTV